MYHQQRDQLVHLISIGDADGIESLIKANTHVCSADSRIRKGDSPLHLAARLGMSNIVVLLLDYIQVNTVNNDGKTALHEAAANGHTEVIETLLRNKAEVDCLKAADWCVFSCFHFELTSIYLYEKLAA